MLKRGPKQLKFTTRSRIIHSLLTVELRSSFKMLSIILIFLVSSSLEVSVMKEDREKRGNCRSKIISMSAI